MSNRYSELADSLERGDEKHAAIEDKLAQNQDTILAALKIAAESEWHRIDPMDEGTWPPESQIVQISFPGFATTVARRSANFFDNGNWPEAVRIERVSFWKHLDASPDAKGT